MKVSGRDRNVNKVRIFSCVFEFLIGNVHRPNESAHRRRSEVADIISKEELKLAKSLEAANKNRHQFS